MGRATRWFKDLFSTKTNRERQSRVSSNDSNKGGEDSGSNLPADSVWLRIFLIDTEKKQNKHAIAVANATATTAEAAVSATKMAAAVVRLSGEGSVGNIFTREERLAAVKIQKVFRGCLARKALRALKGIVKLQALVKGYLVRKRAITVLQRIKALIRVQTAMRSNRINRRCLDKPRRSIDKLDEAAADGERSPKIVDIDNRCKKGSRSTSRSISKHVDNVVEKSECEDDLVYRVKDLELNFLEGKWKFATVHSTSRLSCSSHHNNRYYITQSPAKIFCGNALCEYASSSSYPGYMEKTQSFKAKVRSHSAPRQRSERKRLSLDEIMAFRKSVNGVSMLQPQRYSCS